MKKPKTVSALKKELDKIFSLYIRIRDKGTCYTCGLRKEYKQMQNGHFVPRQYLAVRYDERNNNCQCYACNMLYNGQPSRYAQHLQEDYGPNIINELESARRTITKLDPDWYEEKKKYYQEKVNILLSTLFVAPDTPLFDPEYIPDNQSTSDLFQP